MQTCMRCGAFHGLVGLARDQRLFDSAADAAATTCEGVRRALVVLAPAAEPVATRMDFLSHYIHCFVGASG